MTRKEITILLGDILYQQRFTGVGKYYASEVTIDYGTKDMCRVDYMQFVPPNQMSISGLEKGIFICYEIKSCLSDFKSGHGQNYIGEENYLVMPMELYKKLYTISRMVLVCLFRCLLQWGEKIVIAGKNLITQLNLKVTVKIGDCIKSKMHTLNTAKNL